MIVVIVQEDLVEQVLHASGNKTLAKNSLSTCEEAPDNVLCIWFRSSIQLS